MDERARKLKVQNLHGNHGRISGGHRRGSECALPGEICWSAVVLVPSRGGAIGQQKSAEAIVGQRLDGPKGRTEDEERKLLLR